MQDDTVVTALATVLSGLLSGAIAAGGAWWAVKKGVEGLESTELRRQKILSVIGLYGLRFVLTPGPVQRDEDRAQFMYEINRAFALFADDAEVQKAIRNFNAAIQAREALKAEIAVRSQTSPYLEGAGRLQSLEDRTTDALLVVIKEMSRSASFPIPATSDSDLRTTFLLPLQNPNGTPAVVINTPGPPPSPST